MRLEIIAEVGVNHNGSVDEARRLADVALRVGCDAVKFQVFKAKDGYSGEERKRIEKLELTYDEFAVIKNHCDDIGIEFFATPDSANDLFFLQGLGVKRVKASSQDLRNLNFLRLMMTRIPNMIISTGASTLAEVAAAFEAARGRVEALTILHCVSAYPAPISEMNLRAITKLQQCFPSAKVGLSDHTDDSASALAAVALGATMIEKHLTRDMKQEGPDHASSLDAHQMEVFVWQLRRIFRAMGDGQKRIMPCEAEARARFDQFEKTRKERGAC